MFSRRFALLLLVLILSCTTISKAVSFLKVSGDMRTREYTFEHKEQLFYGEHPRQYVNFYYPEERTKQEILWYTHGGGWHMWTPEEFEFAAAFFTRQGYLVAMPSYRLVPEVGAEQITDDIFTAFNLSHEFLKEQSDSRQDKSISFILAGSSAGAQLSANLGFNSSLHREYGIERDQFAAFISFAGVLNFAESKNRRIAKLIKDFLAPAPENWSNLVDPIQTLDSFSAMPVYCLHSRNDETVEVENAETFVKEAGKLGIKTQLFLLESESHDESYVYPLFQEFEDSAATQVLLSWLNEISSPLYDQE